MSTLMIRGHKGFGPSVEGEALVSTDPVHFFTDISVRTGVGIRKGHSLFNKSVKGKILVLPTPKGGCAHAVAIPEMVANKVGPKALVFTLANPVVVQGAVLAGIPVVDRFDQDPLLVISTGDWLRIDPGRGVVEIVKGT